MGKVTPDFKRMLLQLPHSASDYGAVALAADLAGLLGIDLIGTYVDDGDLLSLVDLPDAREFRAGSWQPLDSSQFAMALASASRDAERLFLDCAGKHHPSFRVLESTTAAAQDAGKDDIVVVIEPKSPIERATRQFGALLEHASSSTASILWVPSHTRRIVGPVVTIAGGPDDPCISAAVAIAASVKERVILVPAGTSTDSLAPALDRAKSAGVAAALADAPFQDDLVLPAHLNPGLLIAARNRALDRRKRMQIPRLLVAPNVQPANSDAQPSQPGDS